jgi:hypothetical protein
MKTIRIVTICCTLLLTASGILHAQFGIGGKYLNVQDGYWQDVFASINGAYNDQLTSISGMYWFRLKEKRIEFLPEIGYFTSLKKRVDGGSPNQMRGLFINWNTSFYFLDIANDCNCPTLSKQSDVLQRGLFAEISPGVEFRKLDIDFVNDNSLDTRTFDNTVMKVYAGLGFDIGLSDLITVTPTAGVGFAFSTAWDGVEEFLGVDASGFDTSTQDRELVPSAGIRVLMRPDYTKGRR